MIRSPSPFTIYSPVQTNRTTYLQSKSILSVTETTRAITKSSYPFHSSSDSLDLAVICVAVAVGLLHRYCPPSPPLFPSQTLAFLLCFEFRSLIRYSRVITSISFHLHQHSKVGDFYVQIWFTLLLYMYMFKNDFKRGKYF